jgi:hypothetical protein
MDDIVMVTTVGIAYSHPSTSQERWRADSRMERSVERRKVVSTKHGETKLIDSGFRPNCP